MTKCDKLPVRWLVPPASFSFASRMSLLPRRSLRLFRRASALGCVRQRCSGSLEYASSCYLPTTWLDLPLVAKREHNHDSTLYSFGLPEGDHTPTHARIPTRCPRACPHAYPYPHACPRACPQPPQPPQPPAFPCRAPGQALNLPTCACLLLRVPGTPDDAVRPYTPISEEARLGSFDLLVKRYAG